MSSPPDRKDCLSILATAEPAALKALWAETSLAPAHDWLRRPEIGTVMARGRTGGTGAPFNLGEVTVTRASVRLDDDTVGHGYVQGRDAEAATIAALADACLQGEAAERVRRDVIAPLRRARDARRREVGAKAAATRVDFFTLVRGEDA